MPSFSSKLRALLLSAALAGLAALPAQGAVLTVTNAGDSGAGTLRQALLDADGDAQKDTIRFRLPANSTITLTSGSLLVTYPVQIEGPGASALALSAGNRFRILSFAASASSFG